MYIKEMPEVKDKKQIIELITRNKKVEDTI